MLTQGFQQIRVFYKSADSIEGRYSSWPYPSADQVPNWKESRTGDVPVVSGISGDGLGEAMVRMQSIIARVRDSAAMTCIGAETMRNRLRPFHRL